MGFAVDLMEGREKSQPACVPSYGESRIVYSQGYPRVRARLLPNLGGYHDIFSFVFFIQFLVQHNSNRKAYSE